MSKAIVGIAKSPTQVEVTLNELQNQALVPTSNISVLIPETGGMPEVGTVKATKAPEGAMTGAVAGGALGGTLGLLAGLGTLAIPGLGPFIAAGPIMAALSGASAGAAAGGIVGALVGLGIPEYEAKMYEERIKEGGYLIAVHVENNDRTKKVREVFERNGLKNISSMTEK